MRARESAPFPNSGNSELALAQNDFQERFAAFMEDPVDIMRCDLRRLGQT